jgi:hypothetical protein
MKSALCLVLFVAAACSTPPAPATNLSPTPVSGQTVASTRIVGNGHIEPTFLVRSASHVYLGNGDYGLENVFFAPLGNTLSPEVPLVPLRETRGFHATTVDANAVYGVIEDTQTTLVACPLDAQCKTPRKVAQLESLSKYGFARASASDGKTVALLFRTLGRLPGAIVGFDTQTGNFAAPLATFEESLAPSHIIGYDGYVYYAHPTENLGSGGSTFAIERLRLDGSAPPEPLATGLKGVGELAVDGAGIVFFALAALGAP